MLPRPPATADEAWDNWERRGVNQFRLLHYFLARFRQILTAELPEVVTALDADGALRINPFTTMPESMSGGWRPDDDRFEALTGRRPMVEAAFAARAGGPPEDHGSARYRGAGTAGRRPDTTRRHPPRRRRRDRSGRRSAGRSRGRRGRTTVGVAGMARRRRCSLAHRSQRGLWVRLLRPLLPFGRRLRTIRVRAATAALRIVLDDHVARRQRHVGHRCNNQRERRVGTGARRTTTRGSASSARVRSSHTGSTGHRCNQ